MQIYSVNVAVFLGGNKPSRTGDVRGDISVNFSCDPDISSKLVCHFKLLNFGICISNCFFMQLGFTNSEFLQVDFVLEEISYLQMEGPCEEDVLTILEIEQRAHENGLQV